MEVITIDSKLARLLFNKINAIEKYIKENTVNQNEDEIWVDNYDVCTFLKVSERTLQRLRTDGEIEYSPIRGKIYYQIGELKRVLKKRLIKRDNGLLQDLIQNHKLYVEQRHNLRKDR